MELFIEFVVGSAVSFFTILIIFAGIYPLELLLQSISSIEFFDLISSNRFKFTNEEILISILNHSDTRMVTETRLSCKKIRKVRKIIDPVEYSQIFSNVNKITIKGFRNARVFI